MSSDPAPLEMFSALSVYHVPGVHLSPFLTGVHRRTQARSSIQPRNSRMSAVRSPSSIRQVPARIVMGPVGTGMLLSAASIFPAASLFSHSFAALSFFLETHLRTCVPFSSTVSVKSPRVTASMPSSVLMRLSSLITEVASSLGVPTGSGPPNRRCLSAVAPHSITLLSR